MNFCIRVLLHYILSACVCCATVIVTGSVLQAIIEAGLGVCHSVRQQSLTQLCMFKGLRDTKLKLRFGNVNYKNI